MPSNSDANSSFSTSSFLDSNEIAKRNSTIDKHTEFIEHINSSLNDETKKEFVIGIISEVNWECDCENIVFFIFNFFSQSLIQTRMKQRLPFEFMIGLAALLKMNLTL